MKKFTLLLSAMLLACTTSLWAGTITLDKLGTGVGSTSNTTVATTDITATETGLGTFTLNYLQGKKQGDAILLAKSVGAFISNKTPIPGAIKSVEVVYQFWCIWKNYLSLRFWHIRVYKG